MDFLSYFDLFKVQVLFYFQGKSRQTSLSGVMISAMIFAFLIYQFSISELFVKSSPIVLTQSLASTHSLRIDFNEKRPFILAFTKVDTLERFMDPSVFQLIVSMNVNGNSTFMPIYPCQYEDVKEAINQSYFEVLQLNKAYCLQEKNFYLEGFIDEFSWRFVQVFVYPCNNLTSNGTCKPAEQIKQISKGILISFIYESVQISANDYKNPLKISFVPPVITLNPSLKKSNVLTLQNVEVKTDDGWLFAGTNIEKKTGVSMEQYKSELDLRIDDSEYFAFLTVAASKQSVSCSRVYQKLPETLASIAGMANLFIIIGNVVCRLISHVAAMTYLLNKLYYFEKFDKKGKKSDENNNNTSNLKSIENLPFNSPLISTPQENIHKKSKFSVMQPTVIKKTENLLGGKTNIELENKNSQTIEMQKHNDSNISNFENNHSHHPEQIELKDDSFVLEKYSQENDPPQPKTIEKEKEIENPQNKNIENARLSQFESLLSMRNVNEKMDKKMPFYLSVCEYLKYLIKKIICCKKTEKEKLIRKAENLYKKNLDITNILTKVNEIENLKILFLDPDQTILFNYISKPLITLENNGNEMLLRRKSHKEKIGPIQFMESYQNCLDNQNKEKNQISKKLVELCDMKEVNSLKKKKNK